MKKKSWIHLSTHHISLLFPFCYTYNLFYEVLNHVRVINQQPEYHNITLKKKYAGIKFSTYIIHLLWIKNVFLYSLLQR